MKLFKVKPTVTKDKYFSLVYLLTLCIYMPFPLGSFLLGCWFGVLGCICGFLEGLKEKKARKGLRKLKIWGRQHLKLLVWGEVLGLEVSLIYFFISHWTALEGFPPNFLFKGPWSIAGMAGKFSINISLIPERVSFLPLKSEPAA